MKSTLVTLVAAFLVNSNQATSFPWSPIWHHKHHQQPVYPKVSGTPRVLGLANDPTYNRDSCGSVKFGHDRTFWTCRDSQLFYSNGSVQIAPVITSTASWSDVNWDGSPRLKELSDGADPFATTVLRLYGMNSEAQAYFPVLADECQPPSGGCEDGSRFAIWPDLPPLAIPNTHSRETTAYTWIRKSHINPDLSVVDPHPATTLYRVTYSPGSPSNLNTRSSLPAVSVVDENFYEPGSLSFGNYGNLISPVDGFAYLFAQSSNDSTTLTALAKVHPSQIEDKSAYLYWVNGAWTSTVPAISTPGINIPNANAGGQGTYYYSKEWSSYVWVGGPPTPGADFYITTAPELTGPWIEPMKFYEGQNGDYFLGAYSIQAHPELKVGKGRNGLYVTYTKNDLDADGINVYTSPLVLVEWE